VLALVGRAALVRGLTLGGMIVLSRLLTPAVFGMWEMIAFPTMLFTHISEAGLTGALARAPAKPDTRDLGTATSTRLILALALAALTWAVAPIWAELYELGEQAIGAFRLLALLHPIAALSTAPGALLTRELQFGRLALAEVAAVLTSQVTIIALAAGGMGVWSLAAGALVSTAVGTAAVWAMRPGWVPLRWGGRQARALLSFGGPYMLQGLIHLLREGVIASVGGARLPLEAVGYQRWAYTLSRAPRAVAQAAHQVGLPAFARLQDQPQFLGEMAAEGVRWVALISLPLLAVMAALAPQAVPAVFGEAWAGAAPALTLFALNVAVDSLAAVLLPLLDAVGRVWQTLSLSAGWAALTWLAALALTGRAPDETALAWAFLLATVIATATIVIAARRVAPLALWRAVRLPLGASILMGAGLRAVGPAVGQSVPGLIAVASLGLALYAGLLALAHRREPLPRWT
jgi:O-antigen/teichoic acid export membrane protein